MKKYKKCPYCKSEFVCWNWIYSPFWKTYIRNFRYPYKFPYFRWWFYIFFGRWHGECWNCGRMIKTFFKVRAGIPDEKLKSDFVHLPKHTIRGIYFEMLREAFDEYWKLVQHEPEDQNAKKYNNILPNRTLQMLDDNDKKEDTKKEGE